MTSASSMNCRLEFRAISKRLALAQGKEVVWTIVAYEGSWSFLTQKKKDYMEKVMHGIAQS